MNAYNKLFKSLNLTDEIAKDLGLTILLTPRWMFISVLAKPYVTNKDMPVYPDGYAYAGIINIQEVEKEWPATAGLVTN